MRSHELSFCVFLRRIWDSLPEPILPNSAKCPYLAHFADFFSAKWASKFGGGRK